MLLLVRAPHDLPQYHRMYHREFRICIKNRFYVYYIALVLACAFALVPISMASALSDQGREGFAAATPPPDTQYVDPQTIEERAALRSKPYRDDQIFVAPTQRVLELARSRVDPNTGILMFTSVTWAYMDLFDNWRCTLQAHEFNHYVVFAGDIESYMQLLSRGEPVFADHEVEAVAQRIMLMQADSADLHMKGREQAISQLKELVEELSDPVSLIIRVFGTLGLHALGRHDEAIKLAKQRRKSNVNNGQGSDQRKDSMKGRVVARLSHILASSTSENNVKGSSGNQANQGSSKSVPYEKSSPSSLLSADLFSPSKQRRNAQFATFGFEILMLQRLRHINGLLREGIHVHLNDCDTVWLRDPRLFYPRSRRVGEKNVSPSASPTASMLDLDDEIDILAQDEMSHLMPLDNPLRGSICTGNVIIFARKRGQKIWYIAVYKLWRLLFDTLDKAKKTKALKGNQEGEQHSQEDHWTLSVTQNEQEFIHELTRQTAWSRQLALYFWEPDMFSSGKYFFDYRFPQHKGITPANIHNTWIVGHDRKVQRFAHNGLWFTIDQEEDKLKKKKKKKEKKHQQSKDAASPMLLDPQSVPYSCCKHERQPAQCVLVPFSRREVDKQDKHVLASTSVSPYHPNSPPLLRGPYSNSQIIYAGIHHPVHLEKSTSIASEGHQNNDEEGSTLTTMRTIHDVIYRLDENEASKILRRYHAHQRLLKKLEEDTKDKQQMMNFVK